MFRNRQDKRRHEVSVHGDIAQGWRPRKQQNQELTLFNHQQNVRTNQLLKKNVRDNPTKHI